MWLTHCHSPQPQYKLQLLKPAAWHYKAPILLLFMISWCQFPKGSPPLLIIHKLKCLRYNFLRHNNSVNQHHADRIVSSAKMERRKLGKTPTYIQSVHNARRRPRERSPLDNEWPLPHHRYITAWCGTEQRHSSHSEKTPRWFISCLLRHPL